ncbi:MAG: hypothetical protein IJ349_08065 [Clostridia bacterium]|nr:hypothetical protein [Clostridia bacterium]
MKKRNSESTDPFAHCFEEDSNNLFTPPYKSTQPHDNRFNLCAENGKEVNSSAMQNYNNTI